MWGQELREELLQAWRVASALAASHLSPEGRKLWGRIEGLLAEGDWKGAETLLAEGRKRGLEVPHLQPYEGGFQIQVPRLGSYPFRLGVSAQGERRAQVDLPRGVATFRPGEIVFPSFREPGDFDFLGANRVDVYYRLLLEWALGEDFLLLPHLLASGRTPAFPGEAFRVRHEIFLPLEEADLVSYDIRLGKAQTLRFSSRTEVGVYLHRVTYPRSPIHPVSRFALAHPLRLWGEGILDQGDIQEIIEGLRGYVRELFRGYATASSLLPQGEEVTAHLPDGSRLRLRRGMVRVVGGKVFSTLGMESAPPPSPEEAPWAMEAYWSALAWEAEVPLLDLHAFLPTPIETARGRIYFTPAWALLVEGDGEAEGSLPLLDGSVSL